MCVCVRARRRQFFARSETAPYESQNAFYMSLSWGTLTFQISLCTDISGDRGGRRVGGTDGRGETSAAAAAAPLASG